MGPGPRTHQMIKLVWDEELLPWVFIMFNSPSFLSDQELFLEELHECVSKKQTSFLGIF